jgi:DNA primase
MMYDHRDKVVCWFDSDRAGKFIANWIDPAIFSEYTLDVIDDCLVLRER